MIHPSAVIDEGAEIADRVTIGPFSHVGRMARIGRGCEIGSHCEIGVNPGVLQEKPLMIGDNSIIRSGSILYQGSDFSSGIITGNRVTIREGVMAGKGLQVGTLSDIQGHCYFGDFVRLHSNVHVGQKSHVGNFVWIFPYVVLTNDPTPPSEDLVGCVIEDFAVIATMSTVLPGVRIGEGALIGAMSLVRTDVLSESISAGVPARELGSTNKITSRLTGEVMYPWRRHFHRGYPSDIVENWTREFSSEKSRD